MKIFYIANIRLPTEKAHGIQIMKTCEAFVRTGVEVTLVVPRRLNKIKKDPFDYYGVEKKFSIVRLPTIDLVNFGRLGFFIETIIFSEFAVWYVRLNSKRAERIVYSRDVWPLLNVSFLGWKTFWEAHMGSESFFTRRLLKSLNGIVVITNSLKNLYKSLGFDERKIFVSPDAYDPQDFDVHITQNESRKRLGLPLDKKIVIYIGLFDYWKGYDTLLNASRLLDKSIQVVLIGGTENQVNKLRGDYKNVIFLGHRDYSALPENQKSADLLVIPNSGKSLISKYYTSPLKLFAHLASGVPIVVADLPSIREIVDENHVSFFRPDDPADLARVINESLKNSGSQEKAKRANELVFRYSWDNRAVGILNFINKNV